MKHLEDARMNYMMHLSFAWILALKLFLLSLTAVAHGLLPFIFTHRVSDRIASLDSELKWNSRHDEDTKNNS